MKLGPHNLKVVGSNPTPATNKPQYYKPLQASLIPAGLSCVRDMGLGFAVLRPLYPKCLSIGGNQSQVCCVMKANGLKQAISMNHQIMIVEDEFLIAMEMEQIVGNLGYDCIGVADDTDSAIELVAKKPEIALVDVNLSDGPTGPVIGSRLANEFGVKVVFVTANPKQLGDGIEGTLGAVTKPVEIDLLKDVLNYLVEVSNNGDEVEPPPRMKRFN